MPRFTNFKQERSNEETLVLFQHHIAGLHLHKICVRQVASQRFYGPEILRKDHQRKTYSGQAHGTNQGKPRHEKFRLNF